MPWPLEHETDLLSPPLLIFIPANAGIHLDSGLVTVDCLISRQPTKSFRAPPANAPTSILFVDYPLDFESLYTGSEDVALQRTHCRIASTEHLIRMKQAAGRDKDLSDIQALNESEP